MDCKETILKNGLLDLGVNFEIESDTNQLFPIFSKEVVTKLSKHLMYEMWSDNDDFKTIRFVTHYLLDENDINNVINIIKDAIK